LTTSKLDKTRIFRFRDVKIVFIMGEVCQNCLIMTTGNKKIA